MLFQAAQPPEETPSTEVEPYHEPTQLDLILADKVLQFRCKRLLDAGFSLQQARDLALDRHVDLHFVEGLIDQGCTVDLAFAIAA